MELACSNEQVLAGSKVLEQVHSKELVPVVHSKLALGLVHSKVLVLEPALEHNKLVLEPVLVHSKGLALEQVHNKLEQVLGPEHSKELELACSNEFCNG